jgi:hypothetical protein
MYLESFLCSIQHSPSLANSALASQDISRTLKNLMVLSKKVVCTVYRLTQLGFVYISFDMDMSYGRWVSKI